MDKKIYLTMMGLGFEFAGLVVSLLFAGRWIDERYATNGFATAGGALLGLVIWLVRLFMVFKAIEKQGERQNGGEANPDETSQKGPFSH